MSRTRLLGLVALAALLMGVDRPSGLGDVRGVRHWSYPSYTRVVIELDRPVRTEVQRLSADRRAERPERLYLDLPEIWVGLRYEDPIPVRDGLLRAIRLGQNTRRTTRLVIDLQRYGRHRLFTLTAPHRVVIDVYGDAARRAPAPRTARRPGTPDRGAERLPLGLRGVQKVVIDPGHGGNDPGAIGVGGVREKEVTLRVAHELRKRLEERGFDVVMTRRRDRTVSLEERTALAEGVGADVFVSIHANAARRSSARGIETYFLDKSHERHTLRVASRENGVPAGQLDPLQRAMAGLKVGEVSRHSAGLARAVHTQLLSGVRKVYGRTPDLGVKQGPFHVLFLSSAPSILVETGFLTNRTESKRLRTGLYQRVLAEHIARGLSAFRRNQALHVASTQR